jgi:molybdopterin/thiamine biosynthesis adenylyltransferase
MNPAALRITGEEIAEDRFSRFRLLNWWDQERICTAKVLVIGAGALGNEILKNLALLGFRQIVIVDADRIELSNLSRSVLYRPADVGKSKAAAAALAYRDLYESATVRALTANVLWDVGIGLFAWADLILAGLDNREARLWINRCAQQVDRPWIDGAIEGLSGVARVFLPGELPCYECTLGETDWQILERRMSCNMLTREEMTSGKVPTTPTTSSVIAGIQVQEALKQLHGLPVLAGRGFVFDGVQHTSYVVEYTKNPDCGSHHTLPKIVPLPCSSASLSLRGLLLHAQSDLGPDTVLDFSRDIIHELACPSCGQAEPMFVALGSVGFDRARCPSDGALRAVRAIHSYTGAEPYGDRPLDTLGLPPWDLYTARSEAGEIGYLIAGDSASVLGELA